MALLLVLVAGERVAADVLEDAIAAAAAQARQGDFESAIATLKNQLLPGLDGGTRIRILGMLGDVELSAGRSEDALARYQEILILDPKEGRAHYKKGMVLKSRVATLREAIESFEAAIENGYAPSSAFSSLGFCYKAAVDFELAEPAQRADYLRRAEANFSKAVQLDSDNLSARGNLADLYFNAGRYTEAIAEYEKLRGKIPGDLTVVVRLGRAYLGADRIAEGLEALRVAERDYVPPSRTLPPEEFFPKLDVGTALYWSLANVALKQGRSDDAVAYLNRLLAISECPGCAHESVRTTESRRKAMDLLERLQGAKVPPPR